MINEYMDLVISTDGKVCRAPGFSNIQPGQRVIVRCRVYDVLEAISVPESEALLTLPSADGVIHTLEYDEDEQEENADV